MINSLTHRCRVGPVFHVNIQVLNLCRGVRAVGQQQSLSPESPPNTTVMSQSPEHICASLQPGERLSRWSAYTRFTVVFPGVSRHFWVFSGVGEYDRTSEDRSKKLFSGAV